MSRPSPQPASVDATASSGFHSSSAIYGHALHGATLVLLCGLFFVLPAYHTGNLARVMVLAVYAMGYNILLGYTGLLSLGHALFFAAGMYGMGLSVTLLGVGALAALGIGVGFACILAGLVGFLALRTRGVSFMIVTLMFAQAGYLTILYFGRHTRGDEGFVLRAAQRMVLGGDVSADTTRYWVAFVIFALCFLGAAYVVRSDFGRSLVAIRENEERTRMLGYNTTLYKWGAVVISGTFSGVAGASYALLFGYVGASFATVQYSILPLVWVLLGGAGTTIGPLIGTVFMFYLIEYTSSLTQAYMLMAGVVLVILALFAPQGLCGAVRKKLAPWLP